MSKNKAIISVIIVVLVLQMLGNFSVISSSQANSGSCGDNCSRYDVVVIGSEIQGVLLAKEAQNHGLKVMILDPRSRIGGELLQGQMLVLDKPNDNKKRSLLQGEIKRLFDGYENGTIRKTRDFEQYFNKLIKGIPIRSGITITSVEVDSSNAKDQSVKYLTYRTQQGKQLKVQAKYWVENTDFNALTSKLDVTRIPGMESIYKGAKPDYMAATYMIKLNNVKWGKLHQAVLEDYPLSNVQAKYGPNTYVDWDTATGFSNTMLKYKPTDSQLRLRGLNATDQKDGQVIINALLIYDVNPADPKSVAAAVKKGKAEAPKVLKYLQKHLPGFERAELNGNSDYLYIRDYNRYETKYVLDYPDLKSSRMFYDNVSYGGYAIDLQGTKAIPIGIGYGKPDRYGIPLRSFQLKEYDNVLVVGKNIGASIKAYGSARIMPTTALAAQTIGIILGRETKLNNHLSTLTPADFKRIHQYLEKDYNIILHR